MEPALGELATIFGRLVDSRKRRGIRHPFSEIVSLVFLGLPARLTEMAVIVRWAKVRWGKLKESLGFTRDEPPRDTKISHVLAKLTLGRPRAACTVRLCGVYLSKGIPAQPSVHQYNVLVVGSKG